MEKISKKMSEVMKRVLILGLMTGLAFSLLGTGALAKTELSFVFWLYSPEVIDGWKKTLANFVAENPDIEINYVAVSGATWGEYLDKVAILVAGGERPDTIWVATEGMLFLHNKGFMRPLDPYIEKDKEELKEYFDDVDPALLEADIIEGKTYGLPYSWNNMVIWYNTKMFDEAGVPYPKANWTRDEFVAVGKKLTIDRDRDGTPDQYGFAVEPGYFTSTIPWIYSRGTNLLSEDLSRSNADDPKVIEVMQFMQDLIYKHKVAPTPGFGPTFTLFMAGQIAMFGAGRWPIMSFVPEGFTDCDIQYWPKWEKEIPRTTLFGLDAFPILSTSRNPEATWKFIKYMARKEVQAKFVGEKGAPIGNIPVRRSLATSDKMGIFPPKSYKIFYDSLVNFNAKPVPAPITFTKVENIWLRYVSLILANEITAKEGCLKAHKEIDAVLARYR